MAREEIELLLEQYAAGFARGEAPDVREYLDRAGEQRDELARLIDAFLDRATPPAPAADKVDLVRAWREGHAPLLVLRQRRGLKVDDVVGGLVESLGIRAEQTAKVKRYYQQLENGLLAPGRVSRAVFDALGKLLGGHASQLAALRPPPRAPEPAFRRAGTASVMSRSVAGERVQRPEPDEVDRLFGVEP